MASDRKLSNPLALAVLALLYERPMHPYEMAFLMRSRGKHHSIRLNYGSLYTVVDAQQRGGLIVAQETLRDSRRPERTVYALTEAGRAKLFGWLRELLRRPAKEYTQFAAGLNFLPVLPAAEVSALLEERVGHLADEIWQTRSMIDALVKQGLPRLFLIENEHELVLREAELAWVRQLVREIQDGTLAWPTFEAGDAIPAWPQPSSPSEHAPEAASTEEKGGAREAG
jgi:DNA-binding PadR family transcriptional regulator